MPSPIIRTVNWLPPGFRFPEYMLAGFWTIEEVDSSGMPVHCSIGRAKGSIELLFAGGQWRITSEEDDPELVEQWTRWMEVWYG